MENEQFIINEIIAGDLNAFRRLIELYQRLVVHIIYRMLPNEADREELVQEVFLKIYDNLSSFQFQSKLSTWIARIAYNSCINHLKKKKVPLYEDLMGSNNTGIGQSRTDGPEHISIQDYADHSRQPDEFIMNKEMQMVLNDEIENLPVQYRTILTLYHLDELSYREVQEITGLPEGTVKNYLFRARKMLKEKLLAKYKLEEFSL